jgi:predicted RNase H-like HicB family nuclease
MRKTKSDKLILHNLYLQEEGGYSVICLELNVASEADTLEEARENIREAVALYLESVYSHGDEDDAIPRPAALEYWLKYFSTQEKHLREELKQSAEEILAFEEAVA